MKRFLKTSICTLVLSLFIATGISQYSISYGKVFDADSNTTKVEENVTNTDTKQSLPSDDQTKVVYRTTNTADTVNTQKSGFLPVSTSTEPKLQTKAIVNSSKKNCNTLNGKALIYKSVNLSQCKSVKDVVNTLRKNGYTNINMNNVRNIKSLKGILAAIRNGSKTSAAPVTQTPSATVPAKAPTPSKTPATTPTPVTKPVTSGTADTGLSSYAKEVLRLVNIEREKAGLTPYTTTSSLTAAANKRAQETKQSFSHTRPNGTGFQTALDEFGVGYRAAGENIAYGQRTPQEVVTGWMNSPGHRANILNANFHKIGIGIYQSGGVYYWSQEFTN